MVLEYYQDKAVSFCSVCQRLPPQFILPEGRDHSFLICAYAFSVAPVAMLVFAYDLFLAGNPKSDYQIRTIKAQNQLEDAVDACIDAASHEFDVETMKRFLGAASFGKACHRIRALLTFSRGALGQAPITPTNSSRYLKFFVCSTRSVIRKSECLSLPNSITS